MIVNPHAVCCLFLFILKQDNTLLLLLLALLYLHQTYVKNPLFFFDAFYSPFHLSSQDTCDDR